MMIFLRLLESLMIFDETKLQIRINSILINTAVILKPRKYSVIAKRLKFVDVDLKLKDHIK
jgi:hypothetical protein